MIAGALRRRGVLGINQRNLQYTQRWNPRRLLPRVDDKLATRELCRAAGAAMPEVLAVARTHHAARRLPEKLTGCSSFVVKPARGAMGNGIVLLERGEAGLFRRGVPYPEDALAYHAASIVSGLYALAGHADVAIVEERLIAHPVFADLVGSGVPDVRVIVYRGVPVMAMTRLPTDASDGRANLHQGAIGVGIDLASGCTTAATFHDRAIRSHPESGISLIGVALPAFDRTLETAVAATDETGLGYVGADVVVDAAKGPVILELNARPGLAVQLANDSGLLPRLEAVDSFLGNATEPPGVGERIAFGREIGGR